MPEIFEENVRAAFTLEHGELLKDGAIRSLFNTLVSQAVEDEQRNRGDDSDFINGLFDDYEARPELATVINQTKDPDYDQTTRTESIRTCLRLIRWVDDFPDTAQYAIDEKERLAKEKAKAEAQEGDGNIDAA